MTPRLYLAHQTPQIRPQTRPAGMAEGIPPGARLYSVREASRILSELWGEGYGESAIRDLIDGGDWVEGVHWCDRRRKGGRYRKPKIYLEAVKRWQVTRFEER